MPRLIYTQAPLLLAHFGQSKQTTCWAWAIKPKRGDWEAYCSLDHNLALPAYTIAANAEHPALGGNPADIPAMTYLFAGGVSPTALPTRLGLGKDGVDVAILAFDRKRLLTGYYRDAEFEAFVVNYADPLMGRDVRISGKLGNAQVSEYLATVELVPWPTLAEAAIGRVCSPLCDVGCYPGEKFGNGRCENQTLHDGPQRNDWGTLATVTLATSRTALRLAYDEVALSGADLHPAFDAHLEEGDVEFLIGAEGGENAGVEISIKTATTIAPGLVDVQLHEALPLAAQIGDQLNLFAGCRRIVEDCDFFGNFKGPGYNFQGFPHVPGVEGVTRRYGI